MEQEYIDLLTLNEYYLIMSAKTGKPYMDRDYSCYMFELHSDAETFCTEIPDTISAESKNYKQIEFCTGFYSYGIRNIKVFPRGKTCINIPLGINDVKKQFYNSEANGLVYRLKQTSEKKYLRELKNVPLFAPVLINPRLPKQYPDIHYCYATFSGSDSVYYILFTTLQEFEQWNKEQKENWRPLEVSLSKFQQIRNGKSILINPVKDKLILTDKQIIIALEDVNG